MVVAKLQQPVPCEPALMPIWCRFDGSHRRIAVHAGAWTGFNRRRHSWIALIPSNLRWLMSLRQRFSRSRPAQPLA